MVQRTMPHLARYAGHILISTFLLVGCSSKPGAGDIEKALTESLQCPMLEVSDVKKTDGIALGEGYKVSYTYGLKLVGGGDASLKLFSEWLKVVDAQVAAADEIDKVMRSREQTMQSRSAADSNKRQMDTRFAEFAPCKTGAGFFALQEMAGAMQKNMDLGAPQITVPVALRGSGSGIMVKAESGWHFANAQLAAMRADVTIMESSNSYPNPSQAVTWSDFTHSGKIFSAQVPGYGRCHQWKPSEGESGDDDEKCSFATRRTDMDVFVLKPIPSPDAADTLDVWLDEEVARVATRNGETVLAVAPIEGLKGRDFIVTSAQGERSIRIILTENFLIEAIATPKDGKPDDKAERTRFIQGVRSLVPAREQQ